MSLTLCTVSGCRLRGRHLPSCTADECQGCLPRVATEGLACDACLDRARKHLATVIDTTPAARDIAQRQTSRGGGSGAGKPGSSLPLDLGATARLDGVQAAFTWHIDRIGTTRGITRPWYTTHGDPIVIGAQWLTGQLDWIRHRDNCSDTLTDIAAAARVITGIARGPSEQKYLGPCGATWCTLCGHVEAGHVCEGDIPVWTCDGDVYGRAGADKGVCRTCEAEVKQDERRRWLDEQVGHSDLAWTARGIADAYSLNPKTVRAWATDRYSGDVLIRRARLATYWHNGEHLVPWVEPREGEDIKARGDRLHYVADVVELAREAADRREAERERKDTPQPELTTWS